MMSVMAKRKPKPVNPRHAETLKALQARLGKDNEAMAAHLGVSVRVYHSWKYGERNPSPGALRAIQLLTPKN
jgi:DNA-binding transcriptional regulator YiaG